LTLFFLTLYMLKNVTLDYGQISALKFLSFFDALHFPGKCHFFS
jgi:hypothetical protein